MNIHKQVDYKKMHSLFWTPQENEEWLKNKRLTWVWSKESDIVGQAQEEFPSLMRGFHGLHGFLLCWLPFLCRAWLMGHNVCINSGTEDIPFL